MGEMQIQTLKDLSVIMHIKDLLIFEPVTIDCFMKIVYELKSTITLQLNSYSGKTHKVHKILNDAPFLNFSGQKKQM